jgi:hypothetical protein
MKPVKPRTPSHDTIVRVVSHPVCPKCGYKFEHVRHVPIATESYPDVERNELGVPILDENGEPRLKVRLAHEYIAIPRVVGTEEMEEELQALVARREAEMEILERARRLYDEEKYRKQHPKPELVIS